jgi:Mitochondrial carrier protein
VSNLKLQLKLCHKEKATRFLLSWLAADGLIRMGTQDGSILYRGPMDVLRHVVKAEGGPPAIFKGLWPTLLREVPGNAVMFGVYEYLKQRLAAMQVGSRSPSTFFLFQARFC